MNKNYNQTTKSTRRTTSWVWCLMLFVLFGLSSGLVNAQPVAPFSGSYTIDPSQAASSTNWISMSSAFADLNASGVAGAVTITCNKGQSETASSALGMLLGSTTLNGSLSSTNTLKFVSGGTGANYKVNAAAGGTATATTTTAQNGIIALVGADYVTFDGIDLADANTGPAAMEYGFAMYKASATDGCQNNTIKNCNISLYRLNNTVGVLPAPIGSTGILIANALQTAPTAAVTPTATSGANSFNKIYSNTIQQCNVGVSILGFAYTALTGAGSYYDDSNDIGGSTSGTTGAGGTGTGNLIKDWGPGTTAIDCYGVRLFGQYNVNVRYNDVKNDVLGTTNALGNIYGIYNGAALSAPANISNNTVTLRDAGTTTISGGIVNLAGSTAAANTVIMSNNTITGFNRTSNTTGATYGIWNQASCATLTMNLNSISGNTLNNAGSALGYLLYNNGAVTGTINMNSNTITGSTIGTGGATAPTGAYYLIYNTGGVGGATGTTTININSNTLNGSTYNLGATTNGSTANVYGFIYNTGSSIAENIQNNTISNATGLKTQATIYGIYTTGTSKTRNISNNTIQNITRTVTTGSTGGFYGVYAPGGQIWMTSTTAGYASAVSNINNNTVTNINMGLNTGTTTYMIGGYGNWTTNIYGNTISNITMSSFTSTAYCLYPYYYAGTINTYNNDVHDIVFGTAGTVYLIYQYNYYVQNFNTYNNSFYNISGSPATIYCSYVYYFGYDYSTFAVSTNSCQGNMYKNQFFNISTANTAGVIYGLYNLNGLMNPTAPTTPSFSYYNNKITDLRATASTSMSAIVGIYAATGGNMNVYYNSINLNATSTSLTTFGTKLVYVAAATPTINMKNNIFVNNSTPGTTTSYAAGLTSISLAALGATTSSNNLWYCGTPGSTKIMYGEFAALTTTSAVNPQQTLANMTAYTSKDANSITENPSFIATSGVTTIANSSNLLNFVSNTVSQAEGAGVAISGITTDYQGTTRGTTNSSTPDLGAYEFFGISPSPSVSAVSVSPTGSKCSTQSRTVTATATAPTGYSIDNTVNSASGVWLNYSLNGVAQTPILMSNGGSGTTYTGTLPASVPTNATVVWYVSVVDYSNASTTTTFTSNSSSTTYQDDPYLGLTLPFSVSPTIACQGNPVTLSMGSTTMPTGYGASNATTTADEEILNVSLGTGGSLLNNSSTCSTTGATAVTNGLPASITQGYSNYTGLGTPPVLTSGASIPYSVTLGYCGATAYSNGWSIYIDYNRNGSFSASEKVAGSTATAARALTGTAVTGNFTVPFLTSGGYTLMRVVYIESTASPAATGTYSWGETEDYMVNVQPSFTYSWSDGTSSVGTTNPLTYTPTSAGTLTYSVTGTDAAGCTIGSTPQVVTINPQPTAPTSTPSTQCGTAIPTASVASTNTTGGTGGFYWYTASTGGTLLQNPPTTGVLANYYSNNFTSATLTGASLTGVASITGGELVLKSVAATSTAGGFDINAAGYNSTLYQIDYDMTLNSTALPMADGTSYSFGDDVASATSTPSAEHGSGSKFRLGFFTYNAASGNDGKGVYLMYGVTATTSYTSTTSGVLGYSTDVSWIPTVVSTPLTKHVTISINNLGQATVTVGGTVLFNNVQLPASFLSTDKSTWKHAFSARSGGVVGGFTIDNVVIQQDPYGTGYTTYQTSINTPTTFYVSEMGTNGCASPRTATVASVSYGDAITANSTASANTVADNVCLGNSHTLSISQTGSNSNAYTFTWSASPVTGSGLTTSGTNGNGGTSSSPTSVVVTPTAAGVYTYSVYYTDGLCSGTATKVITVNNNPSVGAPIVNSASICGGASINAIATAQGSQVLPTGYGASNATSTGDDEIFNVSLTSPSGANLNNSSTCSTTGSATAINGLPASLQSQYSNYTNLPATRILYGETVTGNITRGQCLTTAYSNGWSVFIDLNRDGTFQTTEKVAGSTATSTAAVAGTLTPFSFVVPTTASTGLTLMRIVIVESTAAPAATGTYSWGETEDYLVDIQGPSSTNTYVWSLGSTSNIATGGTPTITAPAYNAPANTTASTQNLSFTATTTSTGCFATSPNTAITINPVPSAPTATSGSHCGASANGSNLTSTSNLTSPLFKWYATNVSTTALQSSGSTTFTATPTTATTTWYATEYTLAGCESSPRVSLSETVTTPDQITASNNANVLSAGNTCTGNTVTLNATKTGTANTYTYSWSASPATGSGLATASSASSSASLNVTPTAAGTYVYTCTATDNSSVPACSAISTTTIIVNDLPTGLTAPTVTNTTVCGGETIALGVNLSSSGTLATYPASSATSTGDDEITLFQLGTAGSYINSASSCTTTGNGAANGLPASIQSRYSNYTTTFTAPNLALGATIPYSVSVGFCIATVYTTTVGVFIDYNHNGVFTDAGELVALHNILNTNNSLAGIPVSGSFVIPTNATTGPTLMRLVDIEGTYTSTTLPPYTATTYTWGETEDYLINILPAFTYSWNVGASTNVATGYTASATAPTAAGTYNVNVVATNASGCPATSPNTAITVNVLPAAPTSTNSTQCGLALPNASVSNGTGVHTWAWYNVATGGTALQTSTSNKFTTPISTTTTFYVSQVNTATGCQSLPRKSVVANVTTPDPIGITNASGNNNNCWGSAISLTAAKTSGTTNTYTYAWSASPVTGSGITGTPTGATLNVTPTIAGTYVYTVTATDATLGCVTTATITINQLINLAGATVLAQAPASCGGLGSILISPPVTSTSLQTLFASNFAAGAAGLNSTYEYVCGTPTPTYSGTDIILTTNTTSQEGNYQILNPNGVDADIWETEFDLTTLGAAGADGLSYSFGDNCSPICSTNGGQENGNGDKLHIAFDAWNSSTYNLAGIYLTYGSITNAGGHYPPNTPTAGANPDVLAYSNDMSWVGGNTSHIKITINAGGQITVTMGSTVLFNNVQLPAAYLTANKATWTHLWMARTGGAKQGHQIGNVTVKYIPRNYQYSSTFGTTNTWQSGASFAVAAPGTYPMGIRSTTNTACTQSLGNVNVTLTPTLTTSASIVTGCPGSTTILSFTPSLTGYTYQWESSTTSATAGFTAMSGQTGATLTWGLPATSTWYRCAVTCSGNTTYSSVINLQATSSAATVPFIEDFESVVTTNGLPTCMSVAGGPSSPLINMGADIYTFPSYTSYSTTYTSQQNHTAGGSKWLSFYYYSAASAGSYTPDRWIFTQAIHMIGGQTYEASVWYVGDKYTSTQSPWTVKLNYGPAQSPTGMNLITQRTGINGYTNVADRSYQQLAGTFTPSVTGDYVIGVEAVVPAQYGYLLLSVDDITVLTPCTGTPTAGTIPSTLSACIGKSNPISISSASASGLTYQWEYSANGVSGWANVPVVATGAGSGGTSTTYNTPTTLPSSPTYYRCKVICAAGGGTPNYSYSNVCVATPINCEFNITRNTGITYTDISTSPTVQYPTWPSNTTTWGDDNLSNAISLPVGFNFTYNGVPVTGVRMCVNGWLTLDPNSIQPNSIGENTVYSFSTTAAPYSVVAPFWNDLSLPGFSLSPASPSSVMNAMSYDVTGTAPNRVATFQWKGVEKYNIPGPDLNFQVKLYESTNQANHKIEIVYGGMTTHNGGNNTYFYWYSGMKSASISATPVNGELYVLQNLNTNRFSTALPTYGFYDAPQCNTSYTFIPGTGYTMPAAPSTAPPVNDNPTGAISLSLNNGPCSDFCGKYYNTQYATASGNTVFTGGTQANADDDIWFSVTLPATPSLGSTGIGVIVNGTYGFIPKYEIWDAGLTSAIAGNAGSVGLRASAVYPYTTLTSGNTYYIRVYNNASGYNSYGTSGYTGTFSICTYENFPPPANDDPCGAYALTSSTGTACTLVNYTSVAATQSGSTTTPNVVTVPSTPTCGAVTTYNNDDDVWFTYTANNPTATIYVQGNTTYDPVVELYTASGNCASGLTLVSSSAFGAACTNSTTTGGLETVNLTGMTAGVTKLYVRVYHKLTGFGSGSFGICVLSNTPPSNDNCSGATALTFGTSCNPVNATSAYGTLSQAVSTGCSSSNPDDDVWFTVTRPAAASSMNIVVTGSSNYDPAFEVFTGSCGTLTSLGCTNANASTSNATESKLYTNLLATTTTYKIRVYHAGAGFGSGTFSICVYSGIAPVNVTPCNSPNASSNVANVNGLPTVFIAYDNGSGLYAGYNNNFVSSNPPKGPSLVYFTGNTAYAYAPSGLPSPTCGSVATTRAPVWYKLRIPTFSAGVTIRSLSSYGQTMVPILSAFVLTGGQICNNPVFTQIGCSSTGTLALSSTTLSSYNGQYMYVQLEGPNSIPTGNYTISVQGVVNGITLTNPTTTSLRVNFPSFSAPAPTKYTVYWKKAATVANPNPGTSFVTIAPTSNYTIQNLSSNQTYEVWVKYGDNVTGGSLIYGPMSSLSTTAGCGGNLAAPTVTAQSGYCSRVYASWTSVTAQGVPSNLVPAASTYPYRLSFTYTNGTGYHGVIYSLQSLPAGGYFVSNVPVGINSNWSYTFKCVGGALMTSYPYVYNCSGLPRNTNEHHEYVINGVHYVDMDDESIMNALAATITDDAEVHEFNLVDIANQDATSSASATEAGTMELMPNPTTGLVAVNYTLPTSNVETAVIRIMDVQGKVIRENKLSNPTQYGTVNFDISEVETGVYLVNIQAEGYTETKKLVVSK